MNKYLIGLITVGTAAVSSPLLQASITIERLGSYESGAFDESATEIPAFDPATKRAFVTNSFDNSIDLIDLSDPTSPVKIASLPLDDIDGVAYAPNSVALSNGTLAVALEGPSTANTGIVAFYDAALDSSGSLLPVATAPAGYLPDMLTFTPDGLKVLVANEGEASSTLVNGTPDFNPEGSITIIPITGSGASVSPGIPITLDLSVFEPGGALALGSSLAEIKEPAAGEGPAKVRIHPNAASVAEDLEPEYITVSPDGLQAFVAAQENNAIIEIDLTNDTITGIFPLGMKDHSI